MTEDFSRIIAEQTELIDEYLSNAISKLTHPNLREAMEYAVFPSGKRVRPNLALLACGLYRINITAALPFACALELIHSYSLVHDDLPAMDNDAFRRGKPTVHKQFGEAHAILTGDALLTLAFELTSEACLNFISSSHIRAQKILSRAAGAMVAGQVSDMELAYLGLNTEKLETISNEDLAKRIRETNAMKTGALFVAALTGGAIIGGAMDVTKLEQLGEYLGLAFQIRDDVLEYYEAKSKNQAPKQDGSDAVRLLGISKTESILAEYEAAIEGLVKDIDSPKGSFTTYIRYLLNRET